MSYLVCEMWDAHTLVARWTSRVPGVTGPSTLEDDADHLAARGWKVYRIGASINQPAERSAPQMKPSETPAPPTPDEPEPDEPDAE